MNEDKSNTKDSKLEFNTYCIFTEDKQDIKENGYLWHLNQVYLSMCIFAYTYRWEILKLSWFFHNFYLSTINSDSKSKTLWAKWKKFFFLTLTAIKNQKYDG